MPRRANTARLTTKSWPHVLTGFDGSAGVALVLENKSAAVRRRALSGFRQCVQVNTDEVEIHHLHNEPLAEWLAENVEAGTRVGFDALSLMTTQSLSSWPATPQ